MERVDLSSTPHAERQRWRAGDEWDRLAPKVAVGDLPDGRWYARLYDGAQSWPRSPRACAYAGPAAEHYARATAGRWMRSLGGTWVEA